MNNDIRIVQAIQEAKKNDTSFADKGIFDFPIKYSQSEVRDAWFNGMKLGMAQGLAMATLDGQRININTNMKNKRHVAFYDKFLKLAQEYNCAIQYHPEVGMCVIDLDREYDRYEE